MEATLVIVGGIVAMISAIITQLMSIRAARDEQRGETLRGAYGDFAARATRARYEYERRAMILIKGGSWTETQAFVSADDDVADAYHRVTVLSPADTAEIASSLRKHLEIMKHWTPNLADADKGSTRPKDEFDELLTEAWRRRDRFVDIARRDLGLRPFRRDSAER